MKRATALILAAAMVAGLASCGESAEEEYASKVDRIGDRLVAQAKDLTEDAERGPSIKQVIVAFNTLAVLTDRKIEKLERLEPPEQVAEAHQELIASMRRFAATSRRAADAVRARDQRAIDRIQSDLAPDGPVLFRLNSAIFEINRALD